MYRVLAILFAFATLGAIVPAPASAAEKEPAAPNYICPDVPNGHAVDCFLKAVDHLYTMCRQVKSIEIIEFGYEKSDEGVNGAKSEYCVDKHKVSITRPYQAALREATGSRTAVDDLRKLYDVWLKALTELKWRPGESDEQYKERIGKPYGEFSDQATAVRVALDKGAAKPAVAKAATAKPAVVKTKAAAAAPKSTN